MHLALSLNRSPYISAAKMKLVENWEERFLNFEKWQSCHKIQEKKTYLSKLSFKKMPKTKEHQKHSRKKSEKTRF